MNYTSKKKKKNFDEIFFTKGNSRMKISRTETNLIQAQNYNTFKNIIKSLKKNRTVELEQGGAAYNGRAKLNGGKSMTRIVRLAIQYYRKRTIRV